MHTYVCISNTFVDEILDICTYISRKEVIIHDVKNTVSLNLVISHITYIRLMLQIDINMI